ncbi:hypothetical protein C4D60_Mb05t17410 [Musa balbisiana]|uniref:Uncharacterized protein n=1 Tax=Musa balbisiana TaxID=52838 RepID=A0A4S8JWT7_MUSBA|nr:hypothetical protein C4D60_Mb05t17410 [Musa balbisiana]
MSSQGHLHSSWAVAATVAIAGSSKAARNPRWSGAVENKGRARGCRARWSGGWEVSGGRRTVARSGDGSAGRRRHSRERGMLEAWLETRAAAVSCLSCPVSIAVRRGATGSCGCDPGGGHGGREFRAASPTKGWSAGRETVPVSPSLGRL